MGRPKIGAEYKKPSDYTYDYTENRAIGARLFKGDIGFIAEKVGCSTYYVCQVLYRGTRTNEKILTIARKLIALREEISNS